MKVLVSQAQAELKLFMRDKTVVLFSLVFPVLTVAFFGYLNRGVQVSQRDASQSSAVGPALSSVEGREVSYASFLIAGGIGMVVSSAAFQNLSVAVSRERDLGILKRLGGTPLRVHTLVSAKMLTAAVVILAQALIMIVVNVVLFDAEIGGSLLWGPVALVVGVLAFSTMGIALAGLCRDADVASAAGLAIALPMQFLCGTLFPLEGMPAALRHIAQVLPLTYFVEALRGAMLTGGGPVEYAKDWIVLLGCLAVAFLIAVKTFRWE
jgi:ABC-2 type transport system permease protein